MANEVLTSLVWPHADVLLLAQGAATTRSPGVPMDLLLWIGVLIVVVVIGGLVLVHMQKRMLKPPGAGPGSAGIMEELRRMRDSGAMTNEEYDAARKAMARKLAPSAQASGDGAAPTRSTQRARRRDRGKGDSGGEYAGGWLLGGGGDGSDGDGGSSDGGGGGDCGGGDGGGGGGD